MPLPASTPGPTSLPRVVVSLSRSLSISLFRTSPIALFLPALPSVLPHLYTFARRASKLFPIAREVQLTRTREKGSSSLPTYSRAKLYTIASRKSHRRQRLRNDRYDGRKRLRGVVSAFRKRCRREEESRAMLD